MQSGSGMEGLPYGVSQFDGLTQDELIRHCQRLYSALISARGAMERVKQPDRYWTELGGYGAAALDRASQAIEAVDGDALEPAYHGFYRYANDLLFRETEMNARMYWHICPECGAIVSRSVMDEEVAGKPCVMEGCPGRFRPMTWDDIRPCVEEAEAS